MLVHYYEGIHAVHSCYDSIVENKIHNYIFHLGMYNSNNKAFNIHFIGVPKGLMGQVLEC